MARTASRQYLQRMLIAGGVEKRVYDAPPKLPETTNFVLTSSRNEYSDIKAMNVKTALENSMPPLKNL